jgi:sodium/hydrogen antiporter
VTLSTDCPIGHSAASWECRIKMYRNTALLAVFLLIYSAIAGRVERSLFSGPIVFTGVGFILGPDGLRVLRIEIRGEGLRLLAEMTLAMVLFTDAANADFAVVRRNLGLPERLLLIGLPLTIVLGFLLAAIVFPGKPVVTNPAVPASHVRRSIWRAASTTACVPIVVLLLGLAVGTQIEGGTMGHVARVVIEAIGLGALIGLALTWSATGMLRFAGAVGLDQRTLGRNPDRCAGGGVLRSGSSGRRQRLHRVFCRRAVA